MKRLMAIALLAVATTASAQENDTVVIHNPKKVTIVTSDSLQKILVTARKVMISSLIRTPSSWWIPTM